MSFQNELITAKGGSHTVRDGGGSQMMSDGLVRLFTVDSKCSFINSWCIAAHCRSVTVMYKAAAAHILSLSVFEQMLD